MPNLADLPSRPKKNSKTNDALNTKSCEINNHMEINLKKQTNSQTNSCSYTKNIKNKLKKQFNFQKHRKETKKLSPLSCYKFF